MEQPVTQPTVRNMRLCKECMVSSTCLDSGKRQTNAAIIYVNEIGQQWRGRVCADCHNRRILADYHRKQAVLRELGPATPLFEGKKKKCKSCGLLTMNYYKCADCTPYKAVSEFMDIYGVVV